jgi:Zn-dependent protease
MGWSIKLGRIFGIDIKMHLTFLFILIWGAFSFGGNAGPLYGVLVTLALFALVLLHELGHSLAAMAYGISVKDIILLPIGGLARLERMPEKPWHELVVALAGPLVNVGLAALLLPVVLWLEPASLFSMRTVTQPGLLNLLSFLLTANVTLAIFNMIPAFPLDGGRVFRAILGFFMEYRQATKLAVQVGRLLAFALGIYGIMNGSYWLALIALFIFTAGGQEDQAVALRTMLRRVQAGQVMSRNSVALTPDATVAQIAPMIMRSGQQANFAILDPSNGEFLGVTSGQRVARALARGERYLGITEIMQHARNIPVVSLNAPLDEVQEKLSATSQRIAAVYDGLHFQGLISLEDIYQALQFLSRTRATPQQLA